MRSETEMMDLIMNKAIEDDRIRAVAMDGSRANKNAVHEIWNLIIQGMNSDGYQFTYQRESRQLIYHKT
jgi:hypothetical protein